MNLNREKSQQVVKVSAHYGGQIGERSQGRLRPRQIGDPKIRSQDPRIGSWPSGAQKPKGANRRIFLGEQLREKQSLCV
jgi:hypothetical protein